MLRIALVVPDYRYEWEDPRHARFAVLQRACEDGEVDLVVLPEHYACGTAEDVDEIAEDEAWYFGVATMLGIETGSGFQTAAYRNPHPSKGETEAHLYVKHSTSPRIAFEWPGYATGAEKMFEPIVLGEWPDLELYGTQP